MAIKKKPIKKSIKKKNTNGKSKSSLVIILIAILFILSFLAWKYYPVYTQKISKNSFLENVPDGFESVGIDVSHHQGNINWDHLLNNEHFDTIIHFVYCKATEGNSHVDSKWEFNRKTLNNLGMPNGAYHFFISKDKPRPQVDHFLNYWKQRDVDLPPVLDVETEGFSDDDLRKKMTIWLNEVENRSGMRPIIYTSLHFYKTKFKDHFPNHKFWIAAYSQKPTCIEDKNILHWQFSENGILPGIDEEVDLNVSKTPF